MYIHRARCGENFAGELDCDKGGISLIGDCLGRLTFLSGAVYLVACGSGVTRKVLSRGKKIIFEGCTTYKTVLD